jgi:hypothetical protein
LPEAISLEALKLLEMFSLIRTRLFTGRTMIKKQKCNGKCSGTVETFYQFPSRENNFHKQNSTCDAVNQLKDS